jgi:hypothetical protein
MADTEAKLVCAKCGAESPVGQRFCGNCGASLEVPVATPPAPTEPAAAVVSAVKLAETPAPTTGASGGSILREAERVRERERLLTLANLQRMRGQLADARKSIQSALALSEGMPPREVAPIHELLGDVLRSEDRWEEAQKAYETAFALDSERAGAEKKFAEATLRLAEAKAIASGSMLGIASEDFDAGAFGGGVRGKRNPGLAFILSLFVPGFGQLFNGELVKGGICLGIFVLGLTAMRLSPDSEILFSKINAFFSPNSVGASRASEALPPVMVFLLIIIGLDWMYSVFDAAAGATKSAEKAAGAVPPAGDRSGWEV